MLLSKTLTYHVPNYILILDFSTNQIIEILVTKAFACKTKSFVRQLIDDQGYIFSSVKIFSHLSYIWSNFHQCCWWGKGGQEIGITHSCHPAGFTMILCCMRFLRLIICMCPFFIVLFYDSDNLACGCFVFHAHLCFICLFPVFGWMHFLCVCVLSLPVQCWSLSYGKQRRPFMLCAPTWLRQQVWRTFNFFSTWTLLCYSFLSFFI